MGIEDRKPGFWEKPGFWMCASLILITLLAAAPLWGPGMVNTRGGGDSPFLLQRTHQMLVNLRAGVFPVRWMPDAAYGLGYPFFNYYSALPYYLAGLLALAGVGLLASLKLVQTLGFIASGLAMYAWMRRIAGNRWAAWLAAVAYTVAPFHLVNVYVRGDSLSEFYAFVFYPLILWALDGICDLTVAPGNSNLRSAVCSLEFGAAALAYAGLILTHNISAVIFSPFALLYLLALALQNSARWRRVLVVGVLALGCGLLLSAWVWVPTLAETSAVQTGNLIGGYFHHTHHFRTVDLVQASLLFNYSTLAGDTPFAMGLPQAACAALGGLVLVTCALGRRHSDGALSARKRLNARWWFVLLGLLVSTAMITPLSRPLWDYLPLLPMTQFPWRFLSVQALFTAAATAVLVPGQSPFSILHPPFRRMLSIRLNPAWITLVIAALLVLSMLLSLHPDRLPIGPADVTTERLQLYELFTQNIGTTIGYEWLPQAVVPRPFTADALIEPDAPPRAIPLAGGSLEATRVAWESTRQVWQVWGDGGDVAFPLLYWPGWSATVDGTPVDVWPVEGSGYLALEAPPGEHTVTLRLGHTPVRVVAEAMSLAAAIALLALVVKNQIRTPKLFIVNCSLLIVLILALLAVIALLLPSYGPFDGETDLTMDFDQMPYLHHNPDGVDFGGRARLAGYQLSAEELAPGDMLTVTLDWSYVADVYTATVRLVSPAAIRHEVTPLAEAAVALGCRRPQRSVPSASSQRVVTPLSLRVDQDVPRGVYLLQLSVLGPVRESDAVESVRALTPGGAVRGTLYLRPVRVARGPALPPDASVLAPFGPEIRLHAATIAQSAPDRLAIRLAWSAARPVAANYGISLRLLDTQEQAVAVMDTQPGYGFLPTSLWRPGELVTDRYVLDLPQDISAGDGYHLMVILYQVSTWEAVGQARLGDFGLPLEVPFEAQRPSRVFSLPPLEHPVGVDFDGEVRLTGYDLAQEEDVLRLTLWWQALQMPRADYTVFVHFFALDTEAIVVQSDAMPQAGAYPTSWWTTGEVISDTVTLPLSDVPGGVYRLAVGLYDRTVTRLPAVGPDGHRLPDDCAILPGSVEVQP